MTRPTLISPDKYNQGLCFYSFMVSLDRCNEICNTFNDPSGRTCIPNETQDVNLNVCNMITIINENIKKHISWKCKCKFDQRKCN